MSKHPTPADRARMWAEELVRDEIPLESLRDDLVRFLHEAADCMEGAALARTASTEAERAAVDFLRHRVRELEDVIAEATRTRRVYYETYPALAEIKDALVRQIPGDADGGEE